MSGRKGQVLDAALELFVEDGTYGLTHRKIDAKAGVPAGTTANVFPSRLTLIKGILKLVSETDIAFTSQPVDLDNIADPEELLVAWLRRRIEFMLGPGRLTSLSWYRFTIDGLSVPEVRAEVAAARKRLFDDCRSVVVRCGSPRPDRHAALLRSYIGGLVPGRYLGMIPQYGPDTMLRPIARGLAHAIRTEAEATRESA